MNNIDISTLTLTELKALAFDVRNNYEMITNNWNEILKEFKRRQEEANKVVTPAEIVPPQ